MTEPTASAAPPSLVSPSRAWFASLFTLAIVLLFAALDLRLSSESTASWTPTSCNVIKRQLLTKCATSQTPSHPKHHPVVPNSVANPLCPLTLLSLVITVETPYTREHHLGPVNASWEPGPGLDPFTPNNALVLHRINKFKTNQECPCMVHPDNPTRISVGPPGVHSTATRGREDRLVGCAVVVLVLAWLSWLVFAVKSRQVEMDAEEWKLARILDEHRRMWLPRWLMKRLSRTCRIERDQVISDGPVECAICLDDLFPIDQQHLELNPPGKYAPLPPADGVKTAKQQRVLRISCNHLYHEECLREWVMVGEGRTCPLCHFELNKCPKEQTRGSRRTVPLDQQTLSSCGSSGASTPSGLRVMSPAAGHRAPWLARYYNRPLLPTSPQQSPQSPQSPPASVDAPSIESDAERDQLFSLV